MRQARRFFDVRALSKDATDEFYNQAGEAKTLEGREFWLNQVKKSEEALAEILAA